MITGSDVTRFCWPQMASFSASALAANNLTLDAVNERAGAVFCVRKTGTVTKIWFKFLVTSGTAAFDVRLETVLTTTADAGFPSGTLWGTNTNGTYNLTGTDDNNIVKVSLTSSASVTIGDMAAIVVVAPASGTFSAQFPGYSNQAEGGGETYAVNNVSGTWSITSQLPRVMALEYSDGDVVPIACGIWFTNSANAVSSVSVAAGDQGGMKLTSPFSARAVGAKLFIGNSATRGDIQFKLYAASDLSNPIAQTASYDEDVTSSTSQSSTYLYPFTTPVWIQEGGVYYLVLQPANAAISLKVALQDSSADSPVQPGGTLCVQVSRTGTTGSFTEDNTSYPLNALMFDFARNTEPLYVLGL